MRKLNDVKIYKEYLQSKSGDKTATQVAQDNKITRRQLYDVIERVEKGNIFKIKTCTRLSRLDCLWEYKYKAKFAVIPKNRKAATVRMLEKLFKEMKADEFLVSSTAFYTKKDRATILYHLNKK